MIGAEQSIFNMMKGENFTSFVIEYNWQNNEWQLSLAREWSDKADWQSKTGKGILKKPKKLGNSEARNLLLKYNLDSYLDEILYLIRTERHEHVSWHYDPGREAKCILAIHSNRHSYAIGNLRRDVVTKQEYDMLATTLNLARNMSFRCAFAEASYGGASLSFQAPPANAENVVALTGFLKHLLERENIMWGAGHGFSEEELDRIESNTTKVIGDKDKEEKAITSCAAAGIYMAIKEALAIRYQRSQVEDKLIAIQGLDKIGVSLAEKLLAEGADLIVCDVNPAKAEMFLKRNHANRSKITVVSPSEIRMQMGHVFTPCGQGHVGILTRDFIRGIAYHIIVGGAVQLLQANTPEEEITLANRLLTKGVLYIPDWVSTLGSLIYAISLIEGIQTPDVQKIEERIEQRGRSSLREILQKSQEKGISPLEEAYLKYTPLVYTPAKEALRQ